MIESSNFRVRLRERREARWLTQAALAEMTGVKRDQVRFWESGRTQPNAEQLGRVAAALEVSAHWLVSGAGPREAEIVEALGVIDQPDHSEALVVALGAALPSSLLAQAAEAAQARERAVMELLGKYAHSATIPHMTRQQRERTLDLIGAMAEAHGLRPPETGESIEHYLNQIAGPERRVG